MKRYLRHPVMQNALALYTVQFAEYVLPMITIPYLARILQPAGWGLVVYAQNFSGSMLCCSSGERLATWRWFRASQTSRSRGRIAIGFLAIIIGKFRFVVQLCVDKVQNGLIFISFSYWPVL